MAGIPTLVSTLERTSGQASEMLDQQTKAGTASPFLGD
jgi:hypothetical protein